MLRNQLKEYIHKSGLKKGFIANCVGLSQNQLSEIIAGRRKITADEFFAICEVLGANPKELYEESKKAG